MLGLGFGTYRIPVMKYCSKKFGARENRPYRIEERKKDLVLNMT